MFVSSLGVGNLGLDGNDLVLELAGLLSGGSFLERSGGEGVLSISGDVVLSSDVLTCEGKRRVSSELASS